MGTLITTSEYYDDICDAIAKEIAKCTPQLFSVNNHISKLPPTADCSSTLVTVNDRYFLITAAHCVHGFDLDCLGVMLENDFCTIGRQLKYFEPNDLESCDPNKIDIAIFELASETVGAMKEKYQFLQWNKIGLNHSSSQSSHYLIFGYPKEQTQKYYPTKIITSTPLVLRTIGISNEYYLKENINAQKTLVLIVDQKNVGRSLTGAIEELPFLGGISGCGVWNIFNLFGETPQYQLVSLLIGENENKTVLYSSKVDNLKKLLETQFKIGA